eukprot:COSAG06_NODE_965_length_11299_cov_14.725536_7_plen_368_part_00
MPTTTAHMAPAAEHMPPPTTGRRWRAHGVPPALPRLGGVQHGVHASRRSSALLALCLLLGGGGNTVTDVAAKAGGKSITTPSAAFEQGQPALLTPKTAKEWLDWQGAAVLGFFAPNQQGMGLKALAGEYKGRLPLGGVRASDVKVQQMFGVKPSDLPTILVLQRGTVSMRLGGGSNPATVKTLINSALSSAAPPPPPPPPPPVRISAAELRVTCAQISGPCLILVGEGPEADAFAGRLSKQTLRGDLKDKRLLISLGYDEPSDPTLFVLKGNSRPRVARYAGKAGDSAALNKFFTDLKEGALAFDPYTWPSVVEPPSPPKAEEGGGGGNGSRASGSAPRAEAELANGQYAQESGEEVEEIVLEDDDE